MNGILNNKVSAQSLVDALAERIEAAIVSGDLQPGSKLSEQALAASLGVSRGPLREAIRRLEGRKLLERTPNIGVHVASLSPSDLYEVLQIREALEGMACALAAQNMTDAELKALSDLLEQHQQQKSVQEGTGYYQESKDFDFHFRIVKGSRNVRLVQMLCEDLYYLLRVYRYKSSTKPGRAEDAPAHRQRAPLRRRADEGGGRPAGSRTACSEAEGQPRVARQGNQGCAAGAQITPCPERGAALLRRDWIVCRAIRSVPIFYPSGRRRADVIDQWAAVAFPLESLM
jgi:DNA-binding GntR family transcriptional regulator